MEGLQARAKAEATAKHPITERRYARLQPNLIGSTSFSFGVLLHCRLRSTFSPSFATREELFENSGDARQQKMPAKQWQQRLCDPWLIPANGFHPAKEKCSAP